MPIKRVGPNKRVGWVFWVNFITEYVGLNKGNSRKSVPNKRVHEGGKFANWEGWKKCELGEGKSKSANRVDSFIWHPRVSKMLETAILSASLLMLSR